MISDQPDDWWTSLFKATTAAVEEVPYAAASLYPVPHVVAFRAAAEPMVNARATVIGVNRTHAADVLRKLARGHLGEMDHAHLPMPDGDAVPIVTTAEVQSFLEGWAVRIENGADL